MKFMQVGKQREVDHHKQELKDLSRMMNGDDVMEIEDSPEE
jgi:U3 small nucleolar RNA-associated protein 14